MPWEHPFKVVEHGPLTGVPIDEEIFDLVVALTDMGWNTHMSCQNNHDDRAWVSFYHSNFAVKFMELVAKESMDLQSHVLAASTEAYDKNPKGIKHKGRWWVEAFVDPLLEDEGPWGGYITIRISIRFPRTHLEEVTKIVCAERDRRRLSDAKTGS